MFSSLVVTGHDAAGVIEAVGQSVKGSLKVGQRVFITGKNNGAYQGYSLAEESHVFPLHERLSFAQGASLGTPYFTAYKALVMGGNLMAGETVLIHGASGAVGTAAIQIAKSLGATVVGTAGTEEGLDVVRKCGAHHVFNHRDEGYQQKMVEQAGGKFDVILENLANVNLGSDMEMIKAGKYQVGSEHISFFTYSRLKIQLFIIFLTRVPKTF